jgi:hypothetical protein
MICELLNRYVGVESEESESAKGVFEEAIHSFIPSKILKVRTLSRQSKLEENPIKDLLSPFTPSN